MNCLRCGAENLDEARFCRNCREPFENSHYQQLRYSYAYSQTGDSKSTYSKPITHEEYARYSYQYSNNGQLPQKQNNAHEDQYNYSNRYSNNEVISGDEKYIANYVGKNYKYIKNSKFSFSTLLLGPIYFIYRKLFYYAFIWIIALVAIIYYIPEYFNIIYWCINAFIATKFSNLYLEKVEQRVDQIKHQSLDLTSSEILEKCTKLGGTTTILIKLMPLIVFISIIGLVSYEFYEEIKDATRNSENPPINQPYIHELNYTIPEGFEESYSEEDSKTYYYDKNNNYCRININVSRYVSTYTNDINYLQSKIYIETYPEITYKTINNQSWAYMIHQNTTIQYHYYAHIYNNKGYLITYDNLTDTTGECTQKYNEFIQSLNFN